MAGRESNLQINALVVSRHPQTCFQCRHGGAVAPHWHLRPILESFDAEYERA